MDHSLFAISYTSVNKFYSVLPNDWQFELLSQWVNINHKTTLYLIYYEGKIAGAFLLTKAHTKDLILTKKQSKELFKQGPYFAFFYLKKKYRGGAVGKLFWQYLPNVCAKFWLTVEDAPLVNYYQQKGLKLIPHLCSDGEWVMGYGMEDRI